MDEFIKANLASIVDYLSKSYDGIEKNPAFLELRRIANDRHDVAACLVNYWHGMGVAKSVSYITPDDIGRPIEGDRVVKITLEYAPESECEK